MIKKENKCLDIYHPGLYISRDVRFIVEEPYFERANLEAEFEGEIPGGETILPERVADEI